MEGKVHQARVVIDLIQGSLWDCCLVVCGRCQFRKHSSPYQDINAASRGFPLMATRDKSYKGGHWFVGTTGLLLEVN